MESIKLKQLIYLCGTSCACGLVIGLVIHKNFIGAAENAAAAVVSTVAASWVVKREDLQEKFENGLAEATDRVKTNIVKVKNKIQGGGNSPNYSSKTAISGRPPRKALPDRQIPSQQTNVAYQNITPPPPRVEPDYTPTTSAQYQAPPPAPEPPQLPQPPQQTPQPSQSFQEYEILDRLRILQEQNSGLQNELQDLQEKNQNLQSQLKVSDDRRLEFNQAFESLDEQSQMYQASPGSEQVELEQLLDNVPSILKKESAPENKEDAQFEAVINQFSQTAQTPAPPQQQPEQDTPEEIKLDKETEPDNLSNEWADELESIVDLDSPIEQTPSQIESELNASLDELDVNLDEFPPELADELEDMVVEESDKKSSVKAEEIDLIGEFSQALQMPDDKEGKSILSDEQAELEQLFGQTPERKKE